MQDIDPFTVIIGNVQICHVMDLRNNSFVSETLAEYLLGQLKPKVIGPINGNILVKDNTRKKQLANMHVSVHYSKSYITDKVMCIYKN